MGRSLYDSEFFAERNDTSLSSARIVVPHVLSLCGAKSVADFGSGAGTWLRAFSELGVADFIGLDGDYVRDEELVISADRFLRADLRQPIDLGRRFDLVISVEVAEHLPDEKAAMFVESLTRHSGVVLFSAAIPGQRGTGHVNEQWPQYWKSKFEAQGYVCIDCLRDVFWDDDRICWWYRENMFLFVAHDLLPSYPELVREATRAKRVPMAMVHPGCIENIAKEPILTREELKKVPATLRAAVFKRLKGAFR